MMYNLPFSVNFYSRKAILTDNLIILNNVYSYLEFES